MNMSSGIDVLFVICMTFLATTFLFTRIVFPVVQKRRRFRFIGEPLPLRRLKDLYENYFLVSDKQALIFGTDIQKALLELIERRKSEGSK